MEEYARIDLCPPNMYTLLNVDVHIPLPKKLSLGLDHFNSCLFLCKENIMCCFLMHAPLRQVAQSTHGSSWGAECQYVWLGFVPAQGAILFLGLLNWIELVSVYKWLECSFPCWSLGKEAGWDLIVISTQWLSSPLPPLFPFSVSTPWLTQA